MKIANIIHEKDLVNHKQVEFINYHKFDNYDPTVNYGINLSLPTLIVGWNFLKRMMPNREKEVNILKHRIEENKLYWEFSFEENKQSHISGVKSFVEYAPKFYFTPRYQYINIDPVYHQLTDNRDLFDVLPKKVTKCYIFKNRMLYVLSENKIYGLDLEMYKFFKFNIEGIKSKLSEMSFTFFIDSDGEEYQKYYKILPDFTLLKRYMVVLVSN